MTHRALGSDRRGFTLIEVTLAIVVGVVVLAGVLSAYGQYRNQARITQGKLNLSTIRQAAEMYKYRKGQPLPLGFVGTVQSHSANTDTLMVTIAPTDGALLAQNSVMCFGALGAGISGVVKNWTNGSTTVTLTAPITTGQTGMMVRSGVLGNVDDRCEKLLSIPDPNPPVAGMGLSDPWLGYTNVRPSPNPGSKLPEYVQGSGFKYNATKYKNGQEVWGGLAYFMDSNEVEYILPAPNFTPSPPPNLGYFPADPPLNWGR